MTLGESVLPLLPVWGEVNVTIRLPRLCELLEIARQGTAEDGAPGAHVLLHSNFSKEIAREHGGRWQQYGAMISAER